MAQANTIAIKFKAQGAKGLTQAIKSLDKATKSLVNSQAKMVARNKQVAKSQTKVRKGLLETSHSTRILGGSFAVLRSKMLLASFAGGIFAMTLGKLAKLAGEQEKAEKKLETAIGRRSNALLAFASQQQEVTRFGDEETISAMSLLGAYTDNEKAIARLTKASMDLAVAKNMDLNSAVDLVGKSVFSTTNALTRYAVTISGAQGSTTRLSSAISSLNKLYGGQAIADAKTYDGVMDQLGNSLGDLGEDLGAGLIPMLKLSAKALQFIADSIDAEEAQAYGTAIIGVGIAYISLAHGAKIASASMALLNKISKKNLIIFGATMAVGALIDKFNLFADATGNLDEELKKLEGALDKYNVKVTESTVLEESAMELMRQKNELLKDGLNINEQLLLIAFEIDENALLAKQGHITEIEMRKKNMSLTLQQTTLEEKLKDARAKTTSTAVASLGKLNTAMGGSAKASKRLAQAVAVIDTYSAANKALASGVPPYNYIAMAAVIATGLANVATIEAQQFAKGGNFVTNKPELIMVGESGREHVQITPIDRPEERAMQGSGVTININGGVVQEDYIRNELIPAINRSGVRIA
tara:strand:- start:1013 stop:2767 length:1755 start_codon:yes stop_codon:yes gene_type:complete